HELRAPVAAMRGEAGWRMDGTATPEESGRFIDVIGRHALRMERLVKDLLRVARLDARQEPLELVSCDTRGLADAVVADVTPAAVERDRRFAVRIGPGAGAVRAGPGKLPAALGSLGPDAVTDP